MDLLKEEMIDGKMLKFWIVKPRQKRICDICNREIKGKYMISVREGQSATILTECLGCYIERIKWEMKMK